MNCQSAQNWLLQAEDLRPKSWPKDLVAHVQTCAACVKVANTLSKLEKTWHEQPIATECAQAKARFLSTLSKPVPPSPILRRLLSRMPPTRYLAAVAILLIALTPFAWMLLSPSQSHASSDVVDRLLDWNLEMTNASPEKRKTLLEEHEPALRKDLLKAQPKLAPEERELAENLLAHGVWLASHHDDTLEEADRVNHLAEKLAGRVETVVKKGNPKDSEHAQLHYYKFMQRGVHPVEIRIIQMKPPEKKDDLKKGNRNPWLNPAQFHQKQQELRKAFDALRRKGGGFKGFSVGFRR